MASYGLPAQAKATQSQIHCFFWAVQRAVRPKRPLQWLLMGFQRRQKPTSMAFYGRPSLPFASPKTLQKPLKGHFNGFLWASSAGKSPHPWLFVGVQACRLPALKRSKNPLWASSAGKSPHPWLFMGVQACRLPALKRSKPLKPLKGHFNGFLCASSAGKSPHPWLFMGVQACRLPTLKPSKPLKPLKGHFHGFLWASSAGKSYPKPDPLLFLGGPACRSPGIRSQRASQGHIHGFLLASKLAVCQPQNAPNP